MSAKRPSLFKSGLFSGQVWIITGAGSGIGRETALDAAALGAKVAICGRREDPLKETAAQIEALGAQAYWESCDIREEEKVAGFVKNVLAKFGAVDVLVNNAGGQFVTAAEHVTLKGFNAVVRENLIGSWIFTQTVKNGFPGMVHTGAARAGIKNFTKTISYEWSQYNIRANAVAPGVIKTEGTDKYPPEFLERAAQVAPAQRLGTSADCSNIILFLASNELSGFITGKTIDVDGGMPFMDARIGNSPLRSKLVVSKL